MNAIISAAAQWSWQSLVIAMAHTLWQSAIVAGLLWIVLRTLPARLAGIRYLAALLALVVTLLIGLATWSALDHVESHPMVYAAITPMIPQSVQAAAADPVTRAIESSSRSPSTPQLHWTTPVGWLWFCGAVTMMIRAGTGLVRAQRRMAIGVRIEEGPLFSVITQLAAKMRIHRSITVLVHEDWLIPAVAGFIWPTLLLPASMITGWSTSDLQIVIAHELSHARRFDCLVNFAQQVIEAVLFFNPCVWWISRQIRAEREACCDSAAVKIIGSPDAAAGMLAKFAEWSASQWQMPPVGLAITGNRPGSLLDRVKRILRPQDRPGIAAPWYVGFAAIAGAIVLLCLLHVSTDVAVKAAEQLFISREDVNRIAEVQRSLQVIPDTQTPQTTMEIQGTVDTADGSLVPSDAFLSFEGRTKQGNTGYGFQAKVDPQGHFHRTMRAGELISIVFGQRDYAPTFIDSPKPNSDGDYSPIIIEVDRGFDAPVRVIDPKGNPVASVQIQSSYMKTFVVGEHAGLTDANGLFTIPHATSALPARVDVTAPGFEFERALLPLVPGKTASIQLTPARLTTGVVVDAVTGAPVAGARIVLGHSGPAPEMSGEWSPGKDLSKMTALATTDNAGHFTLDTLRADSQYCLWLSAPNHGDEYLMQVLAGQTGLRWKLGPERLIQGHVTGDLGRLEKHQNKPSLRFVPLYTDYPNNFIEGAAQYVPVTITDGEGRFQIENPKPATIDFYPPGQPRISVRVTDPPPVVEIHLDSAKEVVVAKRPVVFKFVVPAGAAQPRGTLSVSQYNSVARSFDMPMEIPVIDGAATIEVPTPGRVNYAGRNLAGYFIHDEREILIPEGTEPLEMDIPAGPAGAATGRVFEPDGSASTDFYICAIEMKHSPLLKEGVQADQVGFESKRSPSAVSGGFLVSPLPMGGAYRLVATSNDRIAESADFTVDAPTPLPQITLKFLEGKTVTASVTDPDGHPRGGVQITMEFDAPSHHSFGIMQKPTDRNGVVSWDHINPDADGSYSFKIQTGTDYPGSAVPIKVGDSPLNIVVKNGLSLHGQVLNDATGQPMKSARVTNNSVYYFTSRDYLTVSTDDEGRFSFNNLPEGACSLGVESTAPPGSTLEKLPDGRTSVHSPFNWSEPQFKAGQKEDVVLRVIPLPQ